MQCVIYARFANIVFLAYRVSPTDILITQYRQHCMPVYRNIHHQTYNSKKLIIEHRYFITENNVLQLYRLKYICKKATATIYHLSKLQ